MKKPTKKATKKTEPTRKELIDALGLAIYLLVEEEYMRMSDLNKIRDVFDRATADKGEG